MSTKNSVFIIPFVLAVFGISCKKDHTEHVPPTQQPPHIAHYKYMLDISFDMSPTSYVSLDTLDDPYFWSYQFSIYANGGGTLNLDDFSFTGSILQLKNYFHEYYYPSIITVAETFATRNIFHLVADSLNLFKLTYVHDTARFQANCRVTDGAGRYVHILTGDTSNVILTGFIDTVANTGLFRINGPVYF